MLRFSVPPGYRRTQPPVKPKLGAFIGIIESILAEDKSRPRKQHHTAKRIFERLRDEHIQVRPNYRRPVQSSA